jgi:hypothetical protein
MNSGFEFGGGGGGGWEEGDGCRGVGSIQCDRHMIRLNSIAKSNG